jgi:hypothetical protein
MKLKKLTKIEEDVIGHLGGILSALFGPRFSVDFSPLFGLRAFGKLLVLLYFFALEGGFATTFRPVFDRPFAQDGVPVFEVLFLQGVARLKLSRVSGGWVPLVPSCERDQSAGFREVPRLSPSPPK